MRKWVFDVLRDEPQTHVHAIEARVRQRTDDYSKSDALTLQEVVWELLVRGVLAPGKNSLNLQLPFVHLTDFGATCLDDDLHLLPDADHYMAALCDGLGTRIDETVFRAVHEALLCYLDGHEAAALALLGAAVETCFLDLERRAVGGLPTAAARQPVRRRIARAAIGSEHRFSLLLDTLRAVGPSDVVGTSESDLLSMFALLRRVRAAGGRLALPTVDRPTIHAVLLSMPSMLRAVDTLLAATASQ